MKNYHFFMSQIQNPCKLHFHVQCTVPKLRILSFCDHCALPSVRTVFCRRKNDTQLRKCHLFSLLLRALLRLRPVSISKLPSAKSILHGSFKKAIWFHGFHPVKIDRIFLYNISPDFAQEFHVIYFRTFIMTAKVLGPIFTRETQNVRLMTVIRCLMKKGHQRSYRGILETIWSFLCQGNNFEL